jgi:hypothetical protein
MDRKHHLLSEVKTSCLIIIASYHPSIYLSIVRPPHRPCKINDEKRKREEEDEKKDACKCPTTMIHSHEALHQTIRGASKKPLRKGRRRSIRRRFRKKPSQHPTQNIPEK